MNLLALDFFGLINLIFFRTHYVSKLISNKKMDSNETEPINEGIFNYSKIS